MKKDTIVLLVLEVVTVVLGKMIIVYIIFDTHFKYCYGYIYFITYNGSARDNFFPSFLISSIIDVIYKKIAK